MSDKIITTDKWGECFFKILPPNMKEVDYPYYQWRIGNNQFTWRNPAFGYPDWFHCFISELYECYVLE